MTLAVATVLPLAGCTGGHQGGEPSATASHTANAPTSVEQICASVQFECYRNDGRYAVLKKSSKAGARTLLWEPGGPGLNAVELMSLTPSWMANWNVVVVPEPWTYETDRECTRKPCEASNLDADTYVRLVQGITQDLGPIDAVYAFSFGSIRAAELLTANALPEAGFVVAAPAPLPGTSGDHIGRLRLDAAKQSVARVLACADAPCEAALSTQLARFLDGDMGIDALEAGQALLGMTNNPKENEDFLHALLQGNEATMSRRQLLAAHRAAFTFRMDGKDAISATVRNAYLDGICRQYAFAASDDNPYASIHRDCANRVNQPDKVAIAPSAGVELIFNKHDPVVPYELQRAWAAVIPKAFVREYAVSVHLSPPSTVIAAAIRRVSTTHRAPRLPRTSSHASWAK